MEKNAIVETTVDREMFKARTILGERTGPIS
jgi:hypothetical protein